MASPQQKESRESLKTPLVRNPFVGLRIWRFLAGLLMFPIAAFVAPLIFPIWVFCGVGRHGNGEPVPYIIYVLLYGAGCGILARLCDPSRASLLVWCVAIIFMETHNLTWDTARDGLFFVGVYIAARLPLEKVLGLRKANKTKRTP